MNELMQLAAEMLAPKPRLPSHNVEKASVLIVADSVQARFGIRSLINKLDWLRLIPLEVASEELFKRKINADIVLLSANKLTFTQLEALAKRFLVVCCVEHATRSAVFSMLRAGIAGVIPLELGSHEFNSALQAVHNGLQVVHKSFTEENKPSAIDAEHLTDREQEILGLMAEGLANKEISIRMAISENTVKFHISSVLGKLSASSRTEAVSIGIRRGLLAI